MFTFNQADQCAKSRSISLPIGFTSFVFLLKLEDHRKANRRDASKEMYPASAAFKSGQRLI